ncbi:MAG: hypothetical protein IT304_09020 [Dehalococcoidia bacterium]|nr:hypothetical protein [Dehalococcoidia bacterium]
MICAVTLTDQPNTPPIPEGLVDAHLILDTTLDGSLGGDAHLPWTGDFAGMRNAALDLAAERGYDWALLVDSDEAIHGDAPLRPDSRISVYRIAQADGTYEKEKLFRLPVSGAFRGLTHEAFVAAGPAATLPGLTFSELPKSAEQMRAKRARDLPLLRRMVEEEPDDPRWWYYLGDTCEGLGRHVEAIAAWQECAACDGWDEEAGWAMYRAAQSHAALGNLDDAILACTTGMARHAGMPELPWYAGYLSFQRGRMRQAARFAELAARMPKEERVGFRHPPAHREGPYDVLRFAYRALGDDARAETAKAQHARLLIA